MYKSINKPFNKLYFMRHKKNQFRLSTVLLTALFFTLPLKAQVNIGILDNPQPFSLLEITTTETLKGGLRLPYLTTNERDGLNMSALAEPAKTKAKGLIIYNTTTNCIECWNGAVWVSLCGALPSIDVNPATELIFDYNAATTGQSRSVTVTTNQSGWTAVSKAPPWLTVSSASGTSGGSFTVTCSDYAGATLRTGAITVTSTGGAVSKTITVRQIPNMAIISPGTPLQRTYVGAFWRANETGERIIRITNVSSANAGNWTALVAWMDGRWNPGDIVLDVEELTDAKLKARNIDFLNSAYIPNSAELYKLSGVAQSASGNVFANGDIIFRIGLKSNYTPNAYPARYAVVLLSYSNNSQIQKIFLRQGEGADYVMLPHWAGSPQGSMTLRPKAVKFSPYNLTAETLNAPVSVNGATGQSDPPAIFTDYPTKAGAFFQWANAGGDNRLRYAWEPHTLDLSSDWNVSSLPGNYFWTNASATNETCPAGYRRPTDGPISAHSINHLEDSEMRQSLWWRPQRGDFAPSNENAVWGFYADGFFDRREIVDSKNYTPSSNIIYSAVSTGTRDVAYRGVLVYNPNTNASLFFPAAGYIGDGSQGATSAIGKLRSTGSQGHYWSSSSYDGVNSRSFYTSFLDNTSLSMDYYGAKHGFSIRCVLK
jgi:hypothetical protein